MEKRVLGDSTPTALPSSRVQSRSCRIRHAYFGTRIFFKRARVVGSSCVLFRPSHDVRARRCWGEGDGARIGRETSRAELETWLETNSRRVNAPPSRLSRVDNKNANTRTPLNRIIIVIIIVVVVQLLLVSTLILFVITRTTRYVNIITCVHCWSFPFPFTTPLSINIWADEKKKKFKKTLHVIYHRTRVRRVGFYTDRR